MTLCVGCRSSSPRADLLLVTLDTLRLDHMGVYGGKPGLTPHLDALGRRGLVFDAAFTTMPTTGPAHASLFTGLLPAEHGVHDNLDSPLEQLAAQQLPVRLSEAGYATAAFVSAAVLDRQLTRLGGFDVYDRSEKAHRSGSETVEAALAWLESQRSGPIFLWVHLYDPHAPYGDAKTRAENPKVEPGRHGFVWMRHYGSPRQREEMTQLYGRGVSDLDSALGLLVERAEARLSDPLWVAVADHGESLDEHLVRCGYGWDHGEFLYEEQIRIPLIVAGRGTPVGRIAGAASIRDVYTTLLAAAGIEDVAARAAGRIDLRAQQPGLEAGERTVRIVRRSSPGRSPKRWARAGCDRTDAHRVAVTDGRLTLVLGKDGAPLDPSASVPESMAHAARAYLEEVRSASRPESEAEPDLDPTTRDELEALGYVE